MWRDDDSGLDCAQAACVSDQLAQQWKLWIVDSYGMHPMDPMLFTLELHKLLYYGLHRDFIASCIGIIFL